MLLQKKSKHVLQEFWAKILFWETAKTNKQWQSDRKNEFRRFLGVCRLEIVVLLLNIPFCNLTNINCCVSLAFFITPALVAEFTTAMKQPHDASQIKQTRLQSTVRSAHARHRPTCRTPRSHHQSGKSDECTTSYRRATNPNPCRRPEHWPGTGIFLCPEKRKCAALSGNIRIKWHTPDSSQWKSSAASG